MAIDSWNFGTWFSCNTTRPLMALVLRFPSHQSIPAQASSASWHCFKEKTACGKPTPFSLLSKLPNLSRVRRTRLVTTKIAQVFHCEYWPNTLVQARCSSVMVSSRRTKVAVTYFAALFAAPCATPICSVPKSSLCHLLLRQQSPQWARRTLKSSHKKTSSWECSPKKKNASARHSKPVSRSWKMNFNRQQNQTKFCRDRPLSCCMTPMVFPLRSLKRSSMNAT